MGELERELAAARSTLEAGEGALREARAFADGLRDPDTAQITLQIQAAEALNVKIRQKRDYVAERAGRLDKQRQANELTGAISALDEVLGDYRVTFNDLPLDQCAKSEQIRVGLAIAMALNPTVRVILLRDGSLLDPPTRAAIEAAVREAGYQLWMELVGEGDAESIVLEDGGIIRAPAWAAPITNVPAADIFGDSE